MTTGGVTRKWAKNPMQQKQLLEGRDPQKYLLCTLSYHCPSCPFAFLSLGLWTLLTKSHSQNFKLTDENDEELKGRRESAEGCWC